MVGIVAFGILVLVGLEETGVVLVSGVGGVGVEVFKLFRIEVVDSVFY